MKNLEICNLNSMVPRRSNRSIGAVASGDKGKANQVEVSNLQAILGSSSYQEVVTRGELDKILQELNQKMMDI